MLLLNYKNKQFINKVCGIIYGKNNNNLILSILTTTLSILSLILFFTTSFLARNDASDNYTRVYYDGDVKIRFGDAVLTLNDSDFPDALFILGLIGLLLIIIGSLYMTTLTLTKKNCYLSNRKAPSPVTGIFFLLGGLLGFIGLMIFLPYEWITLKRLVAFHMVLVLYLH